MALVGAVLLFSQIPGDTELHGEPGNPYVMASALAMMSEPIDWLLTAADCLINSCDPVLAQMTLAPGPSPSLASKIDDVPVGYADDAIGAAAHLEVPSSPKDLTLLDGTYMADMADSDLEVNDLMMSGADLRVCGGGLQCRGSVLGGAENSSLFAKRNISIAKDVIGNDGGLNIKGAGNITRGRDVVRRYKFEWSRFFRDGKLVDEHIFDSKSWYQDLE